MAGRLSGQGRAGRLGNFSQGDLDTVPGLETFSRNMGIEPPEKSKAFSALQGVSRALNFFNAAVAGGVRGIGRKDENVFQGIKSGVKENISFSDVIREFRDDPVKTRAEKIEVGLGGFVADVLFDPLTYLTFGLGTGLKVGSQQLTKRATGAILRTQKKITEESFAKGTETLTEKQIASGAAKKTQRLAESKASRIANELSQKVASGKKLTSEDIDKFIKEGVERKDIDILNSLGKEAIDRGGIKLFGKTLVASETLAKTAVGRAARRLGELNTVRVLKESLGKLFVADFNKNKEIVRIVDKAKRVNDKATLGIIESTQNLFKGLNDEQLLDLADQALQKKLKIVGRKGEERIAAKEALKEERLIFEDKKVQEVADKLFEGEDSITKKLARNAGLPEEQVIKFYFPSIFRDKLKVKNFAMGRKITSPEIGFVKEFKGVERPDLLKNPIEAFGRRRIEVTTARVKTRAAEAVIRNLGKPLSEYTEQTAKSLGYVKFSRNGINGKIEGWIPKEISDELNNLFEPKLNAIDELSKALGFDWATGLFKGWVTSMFPAFHVRNMLGNQFLNMIKIGVDVANPALQRDAAEIIAGRGLEKVITTKAGKKITRKQLIRLIEKESDILDKGAFSRIEQFLGGQKIQPKTLGEKLNPLSRDFIGLQKGREIGTALEQQAKVLNVLSAIREGKTIKEAVKQAEDTLFNYGKLSDFERSILRRIIPFYTFARKNAEFQLRAIAKTPGRVAAQLKVLRGIGESIGDPITEEDLQGLPTWILDSAGIKAGANQYGQAQFITGFGLPIEEFLNRISGDKGPIWNTFYTTLVSTNPLIRFPLEKATGLDFFRDRPIIELSNADGLNAMLNLMPEVAAKELRDLVEMREIEKPIIVNGRRVGTKKAYVANPFALHWLRNIPTSRFQGTIGFVNDSEQTDFARLARFFTGIRAVSIDQERQKYFDELDRKNELKKFLTRMGVLKIKELPFEPKAQTLR